MTIDNLPDFILYPSEDRDAFLQLANQLQADYDPRTADETEVYRNILISSWLRKRYEKVRTSLYDTKNLLVQSEPNSPRIPVVVDSIRHFQIEVDQQKRQISSLRRQFRNVRSGEPLLSDEQNEAKFPDNFARRDRRELAPAA